MCVPGCGLWPYPGYVTFRGMLVKSTAKTILVGALLGGCASSAFATPVALPADVAFTKASTVLVGLGAMPTFRDKELMVIKTDSVEVRLTPDHADCGKMFGIPYLKDKRTKTAAVYQIVIKPIDASNSDVSVKVILDGYMDVNEGAPFFIEKTRDRNKVLTCTSKGWLESQFMTLLQAPQSEPAQPG